LLAVVVVLLLLLLLLLLLSRVLLCVFLWVVVDADMLLSAVCCARLTLTARILQHPHREEGTSPPSPAPFQRTK